jgi:hypothetical protein
MAKKITNAKFVKLEKLFKKLEELNKAMLESLEGFGAEDLTYYVRRHNKIIDELEKLRE